jgi:hypothetical protein
MIRLNLNARIIYYIWVAINCGALVYSGYFQLMGLAFLKSDFSTFAEVHSKLYPFDTTDIHYFDITEMLLYIFIPLFIFNSIRKFFPRRKYTYAQNPY